MASDRNLGRGDRSADADWRFIDALLQVHFEKDRAASGDRVDAVLRRMDDLPEEVGGGRAAPRWALRVVRGIAAAVVLVALVLAPTLLSNTASAAVERAAIAMSRSVDLHYRIEIDTPLGRTVPGDAWFRGVDFVALRLETFAGELWAGEGRDSAWVVPPLRSMSVRVNERGSLREVLKIQEDMSAPLLHFASMLERLGEWCEFEYGPDGETIEARRIDGAPSDVPLRVRLRIAPDGIVREFHAEWTPIFGPRAARLTWIDDAELPGSFYEHAAHHDADRGVEDRR